MKECFHKLAPRVLLALPQVMARSYDSRYGHGLFSTRSNLPHPKYYCSSTVTHPARLMYFEMFLLTRCLKRLGANIKAHFQ